MNARASPVSALIAEARPRRRAAAGAPWLDQRRAEALERANSLAVPTTRDEEWRFTDVSPLARRTWQPAEGPGEVAEAVLAAHLIPEASVRLVFVDGWHVPTLAAGLGAAGRPAPDRSGEAFAGTLPEALQAHPRAVEENLARLAPTEHAFAAVNTAFLHDAAVVVVPRGVAARAPVHVLHLATRADAVRYARLLVVAEPGSEVTVIEEYAVATDGAGFVNAVAEIVVGEGATVRHVRVQRDAASAFHIASAGVALARDARYEAQSVALGSRVSRYDPLVRLAGAGAECRIDGIALIGGRQLADTHSFIDHAAADCRSRQVHKCIVDGAAHAVFNGKIVVRPGAQRTDSAQQSRNLLLTAQAQVDTKPQLEIFADDVKCAHGATVGQLDAEQLFYLRSRGLPEASARNVLTYAFAAESFGRIPVPSLRRRLEELILARTHIKEL